MFWFKKKKVEEKPEVNFFNINFSMDFDGNIIIKSSWPLYATEKFLGDYALMLSYIQAGKVNDKIMDAVSGYGRVAKDAIGSDFICKSFMKCVTQLKEHEELLKHNDRNQVVIRPSEVLGWKKMANENNRNTVELLGVYGGDESHACSAWTSTNRELTEEKRQRIGKLLKSLADNEHGTPFEKSSIHFLVNTDIATHIHIIKHRIAVSCVSGETEIYIPRPTGDKHLNSGIKKKTIKELYEEYNHGIFSKSKNGKLYRRIYGRKTPVRTKGPDSNLVKKGYISKVFYNGKRRVFEFTTRSGYKIKTTEDHKFYTPNGWFTIKEILNLNLVGGTAFFSNKENLVAVNGIQLNNNDRPWTFKAFFNNSEFYTRVEFAKIKKIKLELCKKWGYIHNVLFKADENKNFKKGQTPWNHKNMDILSIERKNGINPNVNQNLSHKSWRITVNNWTREQLPKLMEKFNYICQAQLCKDGCSRDFVGHHVIPVSIDKTRATDFNNLCLVCKDCHKQIHKSHESELSFANSFYQQDLKKHILFKEDKKTNKLSFRYDTIVNVKYIGFEDVYDLEVDDTHCYVGNGFLLHNCNAESARYKELKEDKYYLPEDWSIPVGLKWIEMLENYVKEGNKLYHQCVEDLTPVLGRKRAKESARFFKTYNSQIAADVMFNFRSFIHFQHLRNSEHAQVEVRWVAQEMLRLVKETGKFNLSLRLLGTKMSEQNDNFSVIWEQSENLKSKLRKDRNNDFDDGDENDLGPVIITPSGIIPIHAKNIANFNFWILHTSFRLTENMIVELDFVDGVETLQIISPYRLQMSFGKTFNTDIAKKAVENCLKRCYEAAGSVRMDLLKKMLKSKYAFYIIGVENDNVMQGFGGSTKQEVENILKEAESKYNFSRVFKSYE